MHSQAEPGNERKIAGGITGAACRGDRRSPEGKPQHSMKRTFSYKSPVETRPLFGSTYGVVWRGDESPLQVNAQRARSWSTVRGEATDY